MRVTQNERVTVPENGVVSHYAKAAVGVALVAAVLWGAWTARHVLILVLVAVVLAIGMDPAVRWSQRRLKMGRGMATAAIMLVTVCFLGLFLALVVPPIVTETRGLIERTPQYIDQLEGSEGWVGDLEERLEISRRLEELADDAPSIAGSALSNLVGVLGAVAGGLFNLLTILVLTIFFMASLPRFEEDLAALFPPEKKVQYRALMARATERIGGYVSGNLTISLIAGVVSFIGFLIIGVPFPAALAMWIAITDLIPAIGALLGAALCVLVALTVGFGTAVATLIFVVVYQQVENYVIGPKVMNKAVDLSPAAVLVALLTGAAMMGFLGALLALPLAAAAKVIVRDLWVGERLEPADPEPAA